MVSSSELINLIYCLHYFDWSCIDIESCVFLESKKHANAYFESCNLTFNQSIPYNPIGCDIRLNEPSMNSNVLACVSMSGSVGKTKIGLRISNTLLVLKIMLII